MENPVTVAERLEVARIARLREGLAMTKADMTLDERMTQQRLYAEADGLLEAICIVLDIK